MSSPSKMETGEIRLKDLEYLLDDEKRYTDLYLRFRRKKTGEKLGHVGGRWDRHLDRYDGKPETCAVLTVNEAQLDERCQSGSPLAALLRYLDNRQRQAPRPAEMVFDGARASGKTRFGLYTVEAIAVAIPRSVCWIVLTANTRRDELDIMIRETIPESWRRWSARDLTYHLVNGSTIRYVSSDDEDTLKQGGFEVALMNEAQLQPEIAYGYLAASIRNVSGRPRGLLILATNYAQKVRGEWLERHLDAIEAGDLDGDVERFTLDPTLNQFIERGTVDVSDRLIRSASPDMADVDARGIRRPIGVMAAPDFRNYPSARTIVDQATGRPRRGHVGAPPPTPEVGRPLWTDVTREVTKALCGTAFPYYAGADFQGFPGCIAVVGKVYRREDGRLVYHVLRELPVDRFEDDLAQRLLGYYGRDEVLIIGDSTGATQGADRTQTGDSRRTSFAILREWRLTVIPVTLPVDPRTAKGEAGRNPDLHDSLAQLSDVLRDDRLLVSPDCPWTSQSLQRCKIKRLSMGRIRLDDRKPGYSHAVDCVRYPIWRFEPLRGPEEEDGRDVVKTLLGARLFPR